LQNYDWPGNVRELRNVVERAVILARGGALVFNLPDGGGAARSAPETRAPAVENDAGLLTEPEIRRRLRDNLREALTRSGWKIYGPGGAAERLGVKPTTLASRMRKLGLRRPPDV
jgi:transcriptional regulator with GAF, ATPase, and Fis domain